MGHIGVKCIECDVKGSYWNDNYVHVNPLTCATCSSGSGAEAIITAITIWTLISVCLSIKG